MSLNHFPMSRGTLFAVLMVLPVPPLAAQDTDVAAARRVASIASIAATEYATGVVRGRVVAEAEVEEARLFLREARERANGFSTAARQVAVPLLDRLVSAVEELQPADSVRAWVALLRTGLERAVGVRLDPPPETPPSLGRGRATFGRLCAQCHGAEGKGDGPLATGLEPPPADLTAPAAAALSPLDVFRLVSVGVAGTSMPGFEEQLSVEERWAVALYSSGLRFTDRERERGEAIARRCRDCLLAVSDLAETLALPDGDLAQAAFPGLPDSLRSDFLAFARTAGAREVLGGDRRLEAARTVARAKHGVGEAVGLARSGDRRAALDRALEAYLVFERIETAVRARDAGAATRVERAFADLRRHLGGSEPSALDGARREVEGALAAALGPMEAGATPAVLLGQSFVIMMREGFEAILIVGALTAVLAKAGAPERRREIGWGVLAAVAASLVTAVVFATVMGSSPAHREAMEGGTMVLAAVVLFWVSYWLVSKIEVRKWQAFVGHQMKRALTRGGALALAAVAFLAVYREGFETVLFYAALFATGDGAREATLAITGGMAAGFAVLAGVYLAIQRYGVRLPLKPFFAVTSALLYLMAFSFAGQGIAELQEAGYVPATPLAWAPSFPFLGIFPTLQTLAIQLLLFLAVVAALCWVFWLAPEPEAA